MISGPTTISGASPVLINAERDIKNIIYQNVGSENPNFKALVDRVSVEALHNSDELSDAPMCRLGTRVVILDKIYRWAAAFKDASRIQWIHGAERSGKSALLRTAAEMLELHGLLLASFFFFGTGSLRDNTKYFIPTIAYQISQFLPIRPYIERAIAKDPLIFSKALKVQAEALIVYPITQTRQENVISEQHPRIIIVDGLNECEGETRQQGLLQVLKVILKVPIPIAFLVASRRQPHILVNFDSELRKSSTWLALEADDDIRNNEHFCEICERHPVRSQPPGPHPPDSEITAPMEKEPINHVHVAPYPRSKRARSSSSLPTEANSTQEKETTAPQLTPITATSSERPAEGAKGIGGANGDEFGPPWVVKETPMNEPKRVGPAPVQPQQRRGLAGIEVGMNIVVDNPTQGGPDGESPGG